MSQKPDITDLTICRAAFAAWVFIYHVDLHLHFSSWLGPAAALVTHGYMGVDGFFILSGLILMHAHREFDVPKMDTAHPLLLGPGRAAALRFYGKRLARIYPVHLAVLAILLVLAGAGAAFGVAAHEPQRFSLSTLVQNLLLVQGWGDDRFGAWNYPSWSISTEWAGYLLFPFIACLLSYFIRLVSVQIVVAMLPVLGLLYAFHDYNLNLAFGAGLARFFPEFLAGMATYRLVPLAADRDGVRRLFLWGGAGLLALGAVAGIDIVTVTGLWALLFTFYMQAEAQFPPVLGKRPVLRGLGMLSYCFYMSFATAELLTSQLFRHLGWQPTGQKLIFAATMTGLTFILAILLRVIVEKPCRRAANRWLRLETSAAPPPAPATEKPQSLF